MRETLHAEWAKLRTLPGTGWLLTGVVLLTVAPGAVAVTSAHCTSAAACGLDPARLSLTGVALGQAVAAALGVLMIAGEYSTGLIRTTLVAVPRRGEVLVAKALLLAGLVALAGTLAVLGCLLVGGAVLAGHGFTAAHGYPTLSTAAGPVLRAAVGSVLYLVLVALLGLGIATALRDAATAAGAVLGLLYLFPAVADLVGDAHWQRLLQRIGPMTAGLDVQATTGLHALPIGPWAGLGVLAAWSAAALLVGGVLFRLRDA